MMLLRGGLVLAVASFFSPGICNCITEIREQPASVSLPLGRIANFNCSVAGEELRWNIRFTSSDATFVLPSTESDEKRLRDEGIITAEYFTEACDDSSFIINSTLHVNVTESNDGVSVLCTAQGSNIGDIATSEMVQLTAYTTPSVPSVLAATSLGPLSLNVSWSPSFAPPGVELTYTVQTQVLHMHTSDAMEVESLAAPYYVYQHEGSEVAGAPLCIAVQFRVKATVLFGESNFSEPFNATVPTVPYVSGVSHAVTMLSRNISVTIKISQIDYCSQFPITGYCYELGNRSGNGELIRVENSVNISNATNFTFTFSKGLLPNTQYYYRVTVYNAIGERHTAFQTLYTTDIQSAEVIATTGKQGNITCVFAEGTSAMGCIVDISIRKDRELVQIPRQNASLIATGVIEMEIPVFCNDEAHVVLVYDWEEDGSMGSLPLSVNVTESTGSQDDCGTHVTTPPTTSTTDNTTTGIDPAEPSTPWTIIIVLSIFSLFGIVLVVAIMITLVLVCRGHKHKSVKIKSDHMTQSDRRYQYTEEPCHTPPPAPTDAAGENSERGNQEDGGDIGGPMYAPLVGDANEQEPIYAAVRDQPCSPGSRRAMTQPQQQAQAQGEPEQGYDNPINTLKNLKVKHSHSLIESRHHHQHKQRGGGLAAKGAVKGAMSPCRRAQSQQEMKLSSPKINGHHAHHATHWYNASGSSDEFTPSPGVGSPRVETQESRFGVPSTQNSTAHQLQHQTSVGAGAASPDTANARGRARGTATVANPSDSSPSSHDAVMDTGYAVPADCITASSLV